MASNLRMPEVNEVRLAGRFTRDPELKYTASGVAVCTFQIAVSERYKTRDGEVKETVAYVSVTSYRGTAEWASKEFSKGRPVLVTGKLATDEFEDRSGNKRTKTHVQAARVQPLDWKDEKAQSEPARKSQAAPEPDFDDSDIPF